MPDPPPPPAERVLRGWQNIRARSLSPPPSPPPPLPQKSCFRTPDNGITHAAQSCACGLHGSAGYSVSEAHSNFGKMLLFVNSY